MTALEFIVIKSSTASTDLGESREFCFSVFPSGNGEEGLCKVDVKGLIFRSLLRVSVLASSFCSFLDT